MTEMTEKLLTGTLSLNKTKKQQHTIGVFIMFSCLISSHNGNRLSRPNGTHTRLLPVW